MIYITLLIYVIEGKETVFQEFEALAIPIISKYNGELLLRIRPDATAYIEKNIDAPYEIHFISFESEEDFERFKLDDKRKEFLHLKQASIKTSLLIKGQKL